MFQPDFDGHILSRGDRLESRWEKRFQLQERDDGVKGAVHVVPDAVYVHWASQYMGSIGKIKKHMGNIGNKMGKSNIWRNDDHEEIGIPYQCEYNFLWVKLGYPQEWMIKIHDKHD